MGCPPRPTLKKPPLSCLIPLLGCLVAASLTGCTAANSALGGNTRKSAIAEARWQYAKDALVLELAADTRLNEYDDEAHTLLLGVYQMADPAQFYKLMANPEALAKTLENGNAGNGFVDFSRHVIVPGQHTVLSLDRAQDARFVGISAGYYHITPKRITRLFPIPLQVDSTGWLGRTYTAAPSVLRLRLQLGAEGIIGAERLQPVPGDVAGSTSTSLSPDRDGNEISLSPEALEADIHMVNMAKTIGN